MNIIVCVDENFNIGLNNKLLFSIKRDMEFFKSKTLSNVVIMGRKTLQSLPNSAPLKNRTNIIMTSNDNFDGCICVNDINALFDLLKCYKTKDIYVIGGEQIYNLLLPYCEIAYVTKVYTNKIGDSKFPNIDTIENWEMFQSSGILKEEGVEFSFNIYKNKKVALFLY